MIPRLTHLVLGLLLLAVTFATGGLPMRGSAAELDEATWKKTRKQARRLMSQPGRRPEKIKAAETLGRDDSRRACELLVQWTLRSLKLQQGPIAKELAETKERFDKIDKLMRRFYKKMPPTRPEDKNGWDAVRNKFLAAQRAHDIESAVRYTLGEGFQRVRNAEAVTYLIDEGLPGVQKAKRSEEAQVSIVRGLLQQPKKRVLSTALAMAADAKRSKLRILTLNWFGQHKVSEGFDPLVRALGAKEVAVRRAAVMALRGLDDNRAVKPLIDALAKNKDQLASEIDDALHWYTGKSFEGSAAVWKRWWSKEGAAWLANDEASTDRHNRRREALPGGTRVRFYGIPTESHHIVFILDRSGSMKEKASDASIEAKKKAKEPKPPTTGGGEDEGAGKGSKGRAAVAGDTKMEVARNQLALSVDEISKGVNFGVVFYSSAVQVWKKPPELAASSKGNKKAAKDWFMKLGPEGSTQTFAALMKALEYADTIGEDKKKPRTGADTFFLLSDGSPTNADGKPLGGDELEKQYKAFIEANKLYHVTVHTIGIGPGHNSSILRRLARDTGGIYKAVGTR